MAANIAWYVAGSSRSKHFVADGERAADDGSSSARSCCAARSERHRRAPCTGQCAGEHSGEFSASASAQTRGKAPPTLKCHGQPADAGGDGAGRDDARRGLRRAVERHRRCRGNVARQARRVAPAVHRQRLPTAAVPELQQERRSRRGRCLCRARSALRSVRTGVQAGGPSLRCTVPAFERALVPGLTGPRTMRCCSPSAASAMSHRASSIAWSTRCASRPKAQLPARLAGRQLWPVRDPGLPRVVIEAIAMDGDRSFVHCRYARAYGRGPAPSVR